MAVGDTFEIKRTCDRYLPIYYAAASGDFNPIHIDGEAGQAAGLGGAILQGLCTMAWAADAVTSFLGDPTRLKRLRVRFSRPVRINDEITFVGKVVSIDGGLVKGELSAKNQTGEDVLKGAAFEGVTNS